MFSRRHDRHQESFSSRYGAGKSSSRARHSSIREGSITTGLQRAESVNYSPRKEETTLPVGSAMTSPIITLCVGPEKRLFAGHEDVLCRSPYFQAACKGQFFESHAKVISLPDEQPEILSSILEYLYKGDYFPRLLHNKRKDTWELEDASANPKAQLESTIYHPGLGQTLLKDTVIYCAAERYCLPQLARLALRKQGLQAGISLATILNSGRYAYMHTPDTDSKLRAHYLALIIRSKAVFKKSATMQQEMEKGGSQLWFDLFVAMCNHMDDLSTVNRSPIQLRSPFTR